MNKTIHIGIIDPDKQYITSFSRFFVGMQVKITSFVSENQVTKEVMRDFDMIYVDYRLGWTTGNKLIDDLYDHTNADFALISNTNEQYQKRHVNNERISGIITKWNKEYVLEWFYYIKNKRANLYPRT